MDLSEREDTVCLQVPAAADGLDDYRRWLLRRAGDAPAGGRRRLALTELASALGADVDSAEALRLGVRLCRGEPGDEWRRVGLDLLRLLAEQQPELAEVYDEELSHVGLAELERLG